MDTLDEGPVILIMSQYAHSPTSKTIHSKMPLEHFGCKVHDSTQAVGGKQIMIIPESYAIPLHVRNRLLYMDMHPPMDAELAVFITADSHWDPQSIKQEYYFDAQESLFDSDLQTLHDNHDPFIMDLTLDLHTTHLHDAPTAPPTQSLFPQNFVPHLPDLDFLHPSSGWISVDRIKDTLAKTTQYYCAIAQYLFCKHFHSRFPAANVQCLEEWFAMDTLFIDVPADDDGIPSHSSCTMAQLYTGLNSEFIKIFPMGSVIRFCRSYPCFR